MSMTQDYLKSRLSYNPATGVFIWLPTGNAKWDGKFAGATAGTVRTKGNGYRTISICLDYKIYKAHRLAWVYMTGDAPPQEIDHINRDATDNSWKNLRDSEGLNQRNKSKQRNNTSGVTGVSWSNSAKKWCARVWDTVDGKKVYRHLGLYRTLESAALSVSAFREGKYDPTHGAFAPPYAKGAN